MEQIKFSGTKAPHGIKSQTFPKNRRCTECGAILSIYNGKTKCFVHETNKFVVPRLRGRKNPQPLSSSKKNGGKESSNGTNGLDATEEEIEMALKMIGEANGQSFPISGT